MLGILLTELTGNRWNIALLGLVAPVPILVAALRLPGWRGSALLFLAVNVACFLQVLKIITAPLSAPMTLMFSVPAGVSMWLPNNMGLDNLSPRHGLGGIQLCCAIL